MDQYPYNAPTSCHYTTTTTTIPLRSTPQQGAHLHSTPGGVGCVGVQRAWLQFILKNQTAMVRVCAFPNCGNKMSSHTSRSFHRLPLLDKDRRKLWLDVLQMDPNTPVQTLRLADHRVCSDHFNRDDYSQPRRRANIIPRHFYLKKNAVPRVERPAAGIVEVT